MENIVNDLRNKMIEIGLEKGYSHPETIKWSQLLDRFIVDIQQKNLEHTKLNSIGIFK